MGESSEKFQEKRRIGEKEIKGKGNKIDKGYLMCYYKDSSRKVDSRNFKL